VKSPPEVSDHDYARLLAVRTRLRRFEHWSAEQAATYGLTAQQHQLLLAVRGHDEPQGPTISQVADYLLIRHHTAVELVDRVASADLITRDRDAANHRIVRLQLTPKAQRTLEALSSVHLEELANLTEMLDAMLDDLAVHGAHE
jgi:DNA-binding MarR family transcriptional regulator